MEEMQAASEGELFDQTSSSETQLPPYSKAGSPPRYQQKSLAKSEITRLAPIHRH